MPLSDDTVRINRAPVCITGMHRSGTSMVSHLLHECGLYLGPEESLLSASAENPDGYWENTRIVTLNDSLLEMLGGAWDAPPSQVEPETLLQEYGEQALELASDLHERALWGWKDPRVCLTLPFWQAVFPHLRLVVCVRSPIEVARSLNHRQDAMGYDHGLELCSSYYESLMRYLRPEDRIVFTHFETWFYDPVRELQRLASELKLSIPPETIEAATQIVSGSLRHNASTPQLLRDAHLPNVIEQIYDALLEKVGPVFADMEADDAYQQNLTQNLQAVLQEELIATERRLSDVRWELKTTTASLSNLHQEAHRLQIALAEREHELELLKPLLAQREQQLRDLHASRAYRVYERLVKPVVKKKS